MSQLPRCLTYVPSSLLSWWSVAILSGAIWKVLTLGLVVMAASSQVVYGQIQWNPLEIVLIWDNRAAKFFVGLL